MMPLHSYTPSSYILENYSGNGSYFKTNPQFRSENLTELFGFVNKLPRVKGRLAATVSRDANQPEALCLTLGRLNQPRTRTIYHDLMQIGVCMNVIDNNVGGLSYLVTHCHTGALYGTSTQSTLEEMKAAITSVVEHQPQNGKLLRILSKFYPRINPQAAIDEIDPRQFSRSLSWRPWFARF